MLSSARSEPVSTLGTVPIVADAVPFQIVIAPE